MRFGVAVLVGFIATAATMFGALALGGIGDLGASCIEEQYSGGRLIDCGSRVTFVPNELEEPGESESPSYGSMRLPPSMIGVVASKLSIESNYTSCKSIPIPEGRWTVCDDGFSLLERNEEAQRAAARDRSDSADSESGTAAR
jgi:hypothetical protein